MNDGLLWMARPTKPRVKIYMVTENRIFSLFTGEWVDADDMVLNSVTAVVKAAANGRSITLYSRTGYAQRILFINRSNGNVIGTIEITAQGAIISTDGKGKNIMNEWPVLWKTQTVTIIGVTGSCSIRLRDMISLNEGVFRFVEPAKAWEIPVEFLDQTRAHDIPGYRRQSNQRSAWHEHMMRTTQSNVLERSENESEVASVANQSIGNDDWDQATERASTVSPQNLRERLVAVVASTSHDSPTEDHGESSTVQSSSDKSEATNESEKTETVVETTNVEAAVDEGEVKSEIGASIQQGGPSPAVNVNTATVNHIRRIQWLNPDGDIPAYAHYTEQGRPYVHLEGWCEQCMGTPM